MGSGCGLRSLSCLHCPRLDFTSLYKCTHTSRCPLQSRSCLCWHIWHIYFIGNATQVLNLVLSSAYLLISSQVPWLHRLHTIKWRITSILDDTYNNVWVLWMCFLFTGTMVQLLPLMWMVICIWFHCNSMWWTGSGLASESTWWVGDPLQEMP